MEETQLILCQETMCHTMNDELMSIKMQNKFGENCKLFLEMIILFYFHKGKALKVVVV